MNEWEELRRGGLTRHRQSTIVIPRDAHAPRSSTSMSPYDIPEAVRASIHDDALVIQFRYATDEPLVQKGATDRIQLWIGKNSGRLYQINAMVDGIVPGDAVRVMLGETYTAIDCLAKDTSLSKRQENYGVAKDIISTRIESFLHPAVSGQ